MSDKPLTELPPGNPNALGLYMADQEWALLQSELASIPSIRTATVYGSRQSGARRDKAEPQPLDIDLAIEFSPSPNNSYIGEFISIREQLGKISSLTLQVEDKTDAESPWFNDRQRGVMIYSR